MDRFVYDMETRISMFLIKGKKHANILGGSLSWGLGGITLLKFIYFFESLLAEDSSQESKFIYKKMKKRRRRRRRSDFPSLIITLQITHICDITI